MKKNKHHNKLTLFAIMFVLATLMGCPNKKAAPKKTAAAKKSIKHAPKKKKGLSIDENPDTVEEDIVEEEDKDPDGGSSDDENSEHSFQWEDKTPKNTFLERDFKDEVGKVNVAELKAIIESEFDKLPSSFGVLRELLHYLLKERGEEEVHLKKDTLIKITKKAATMGLKYYLGDNEVNESAMSEIFDYAATDDEKEIAQASLDAMKKQSWYEKQKDSKYCIAAVSYLNKKINFNYEDGAYPRYEFDLEGDDGKDEDVETSQPDPEDDSKGLNMPTSSDKPNPKGENKEDVSLLVKASKIDVEGLSDEQKNFWGLLDYLARTKTKWESNEKLKEAFDFYVTSELDAKEAFYNALDAIRDRHKMHNAHLEAENERNMLSELINYLVEDGDENLIDPKILQETVDNERKKEVRSDALGVLGAMGKKVSSRVEFLEEELRNAMKEASLAAESGTKEEKEKAALEVSYAENELVLREAYDYYSNDKGLKFLALVVTLPPNTDLPPRERPSGRGESRSTKYLNVIADFLAYKDNYRTIVASLLDTLEADKDTYPEDEEKRNDLAERRVEVIKTGINAYLSNKKVRSKEYVQGNYHLKKKK